MYRYQLYDSKDDKLIKTYHCEGVGIRSMGGILEYSPNTIIHCLLYLADKVIKPVYSESNQIYEVDEFCTYVGRNDPSHYKWVTYAINRSTKTIIDVVIGSRSKDNLGKVINSVKQLSPLKIITDRLPVYVNLVKPVKHETHKYGNNYIEPGNLTLRTHTKRLSRQTICFSRSLNMLRASILLYFDYRGWMLQIE